MFLGENEVKLDTKGRIFFPSVLRRQLPDGSCEAGFVLKKDIYTPSLLLYPRFVWDRLTSVLRRKLNPFNRRHAEFLREFYRGTAEVYLDGNGRMLIPRRLLEAISADKDLMFVGQDDLIQIWSLDSYARVQISEADLATLTEEVMGNEFTFYDNQS